MLTSLPIYQLETCTLGVPVEPLVYMTMAVSSGVGATVVTRPRIESPDCTTLRKGRILTCGRKPFVCVDCSWS